MARSRPSNRTRPPVGSIRRRMSRPSVDLPDPDSPTSPRVSPGAIVRFTPLTALTVSCALNSPVEPAANSLLRFSVRTSAPPAAAEGAWIGELDTDAGGIVVVHLLLKRRINVSAIGDRDRTSWMESASGRWVQRVRNSSRYRVQTLSRCIIAYQERY